MSNLRNKIIKLAYNKPEIREDLLPLLKTAGVDPKTLEKKLQKTFQWARVEPKKMTWLQTKGNEYVLKVQALHGGKFLLKFEVLEDEVTQVTIEVKVGRQYMPMRNVPGIDWEREISNEMFNLRQEQMI